MATRFYLTQTRQLDTNLFPAADAGWEQLQVPPYKLRLATSKSSTATDFSLLSLTEGTSTADRDLLLVQAYSKPLEAQTITGTIKGIIRAGQTNAGDDSRSQLMVRVLSPDGVVRGTLLAMSTAALASEWDPTLIVNRKFPLAWAGAGASLGSVAAQRGDFLSIEIGFRSHAVSLSTGRIYIGTDPSNDLAEDETSTDQYSPWIEFSQTLNFATEETGRPDSYQLDVPAFEISYNGSSFVDAKTYQAKITDLAHKEQVHPLDVKVYRNQVQPIPRGRRKTALWRFPDTEVQPSYGTPDGVGPRNASVKDTVIPAYETGGGTGGGTLIIREFRNTVYDTVAVGLVSWISSPEPDTLGATYPGPGTFGVDTSNFTSDRLE